MRRLLGDFFELFWDYAGPTPLLVIPGILLAVCAVVFVVYKAHEEREAKSPTYPVDGGWVLVAPGLYRFDDKEKGITVYLKPYSEGPSITSCPTPKVQAEETK